MKTFLRKGVQNGRLLSFFLGWCCFTGMPLNRPFQAHAQCNNNTVLTLTGPGTSSWTAPASGGPFSVRITATGAAGGAYLESNPDKTGGTGATMSGTFVVQNGEKLFAIAGGGGFHSLLEGGGGAGGSGVVNCGNPADCPGGTILIIAAGGNGGQLGGPTGGNGLGGSADTNGSGDGGLISNNDCGGGGGALNGPGQTAGSGGQGGDQVSTSGISMGGEGSRNLLSNPPSGINDGGNGMGGGGGGGDGATTDNAAGGGGGHTGADGGNASAASSFNSGSDQANTSGITGGAGSGPKSTPAFPGTITIVCLQALPIALVNFKAAIQDDRVQLHWVTASEKDNFGFDIERSMNGIHWTVLGFVPGNGTTTIRHDYSFTDASPLPGVNYYRLRQQDTDGQFEYSPMVIADLRITNALFDVFPNPSATGELTVRTVGIKEGNALLEIFDWVGYKVYRETLHILKGTTVYPVSLANFPPGAYTARLEMPDGEVQFEKLLLQNSGN